MWCPFVPQYFMSKQVGSIQRPGWKRSSVKHLSPGSDVVSLVVLSNSSPINVLISSGEQKALRPLLKCRMMYLIRFMYELNSSFCDLAKKKTASEIETKNRRIGKYCTFLKGRRFTYSIGLGILENSRLGLSASKGFFRYLLFSCFNLGG